MRLCTYSEELIRVMGSLTVVVSYKHYYMYSQEPLLVVEGSDPNLLKMNWLDHIQLDWKQINQVQQSSLHAVLQQHEAVFQRGLGALKGYQARILVDQNPRSRCCKAHSVPYTYRELVENELDRLVADEILEPVEFSEWAVLIVPVLKSNS